MEEEGVVMVLLAVAVVLVRGVWMEEGASSRVADFGFSTGGTPLPLFSSWFVRLAFSCLAKKPPPIVGSSGGRLAAGGEGLCCS